MGDNKAGNGVSNPSFRIIEPADDTANKLFVGGISPQTTEKNLETFFSTFGSVKDVRIVTDRVTAECKGYGFVTFEESEVVERLVREGVIRMNERKLRVKKAVPKTCSQFQPSPVKRVVGQEVHSGLPPSPLQPVVFQPQYAQTMCSQPVISPQPPTVFVPLHPPIVMTQQTPHNMVPHRPVACFPTIRADMPAPPAVCYIPPQNMQNAPWK